MASTRPTCSREATSRCRRGTSGSGEGLGAETGAFSGRLPTARRARNVCAPAKLGRRKNWNMPIRPRCVAILFASLLIAATAMAARIDVADKYFNTSDGTRLHYLDAGQGATIVFVPGWTMP